MMRKVAAAALGGFRASRNATSPTAKLAAKRLIEIRNVFGICNAENLQPVQMRMRHSEVCCIEIMAGKCRGFICIQAIYYG